MRDQPDLVGLLYRADWTRLSLGAEVSVTFFMAAMPAMGMAAMNTTIKAGDRGGGMYAGEGNLESGGTWQVTVTVRQAGRTLAAKHLTVNATGGMSP